MLCLHSIPVHDLTYQSDRLSREVETLIAMIRAA
jgi:hypothetical protein